MRNMKTVGVLVGFMFLAGCSSTQKTAAGWAFTAGGVLLTGYSIGLYSVEVAHLSKGQKVPAASQERLGVGLGISTAALIVGVACLVAGSSTGKQDAAKEQEERLEEERRLEAVEVRTEHQNRMRRQRRWEQNKRRKRGKNWKWPASQPVNRPIVPKPPN